MCGDCPMEQDEPAPSPALQGRMGDFTVPSRHKGPNQAGAGERPLPAPSPTLSKPAVAEGPAADAEAGFPIVVYDRSLISEVWLFWAEGRKQIIDVYPKSSYIIMHPFQRDSVQKPCHK